jgi:hypothetical protein
MEKLFAHYAWDIISNVLPGLPIPGQERQDYQILPEQQPELVFTRILKQW